MSIRRRPRATIEIGHDAFLDIVANLVGILIILVVVLGSQSQQAIEQINTEDEATEVASDQQLAALATQTTRAAAAQADSDRLERRARTFDEQIQFRQRQRDAFLDLLTVAQETWEEAKQKYDRRSVEAAQRESRRKQLQQELEAVQGQRERLEERDAPVVAVAHLPTPMAKTVFGDEVHFRLKDNRLSLVPVDQLLEEIRQDFTRMAGSSRNGQMDAAVGPVRGYVARYAMNKESGMVNRGGRVGMATRLQLTAMIVEPLEEPFGQAIEKVLSNSSQLDVELAGRDPASTTVTVWVYPDSFAAFRRLKEHLYAKGFATAARPLPAGQPIMGGPQGSRSDAQ